MGLFLFGSYIKILVLHIKQYFEERMTVHTKAMT